MRDHAGIAMIVTPKGIIVVREPGKPPPLYWKLPGGMSEEGETPQQTAWREFLGETGVYVEPRQLRSVLQAWKKNHDWYLFRADLDYVPKLAERGHEGEEVRIMTPQEILAADDFLPSQLKLIRPHLEKLLRKGVVPQGV